VLSVADFGDPRLGDTRLLCIFFVLMCEPWALLAAWVLAVDTDLVRAEGRVAAVAGAAHTHSDRLGDSGKLQIGG